MNIPTREECLKILVDEKVPDNIIAHSKKVCEIALELCEVLKARKIEVNRDLVQAGALLHDVKKLSKGDHVTEGKKLAESLGYPEVGRVMGKHGLANLDKDEFKPITWEEKIVFYADKRVKHDQVVTVEKRFEYIRATYNREIVEPEYNFTKEIEKELFEGDPSF